MSKEQLRDFLRRNLRTRSDDQIASIVEDLQTFSDRYVCHHKSVLLYRKESSLHSTIASLKSSAKALRAALNRLDTLYVEDLETYIGLRHISVLSGDLARLQEATERLKVAAVKRGPKVDVAQRWWLARLAEIFEREFGKPPGISRSSFSHAKGQAGPFYEFLKLAYPSGIKGMRLFHPRHVKRALLEGERANETTALPSSSARTRASIQTKSRI